ncbi:hypothetical protein [Halovivax sp.]|uniref:hypothetical protein n=1 Tax=Halovivax sp. TaxID=1935978 RepID=UPI0025BA5CAF|nr:hypothetical protein [Halovivax sp.]
MSGGASIGWGRTIERLCYLYPPVIGVGAIGVLREADPGVPLLGEGLVLVGTFGYLAVTVALAIAVGLDAQALGRTGRWRPRPGLNGATAALIGPVAGAVYLARRHRRFPTPAGWSGWWLVIALSLGTTLFAIAAAAIGVALALPMLALTGVAVAGAIALGAFPVAIHLDAAYVAERGLEWRPNPGVYLGLAFLSLSVPVLQPIVAAYYLVRRRRARTEASEASEIRGDANGERSEP